MYKKPGKGFAERLTMLVWVPGEFPSTLFIGMVRFCFSVSTRPHFIDGWAGQLGTCSVHIYDTMEKMHSDSV